MLEWIVTLSVEERWLYGIIAAASASLIIGLVKQGLNHVFAVRRERHKIRVKASINFRSIISIERIESFREYHLLNVLHDGLFLGSSEKCEGEYFKHKRAVHEYRVYLRWYDRCRLDKAWGKYHGGNEDNPDIFQYCNRDNGHEILLTRLEKLKSIGNKI